ncbi:hypothetical protein ACQ4PT_046899 [Festuca glaucescens]
MNHLVSEVWVQLEGFVEDELLHLVLSERVLLEVEGEGVRADGLVGDVVQPLQVRVLQGLLNCDPLQRVEGEHPLDEVERGGLHLGELAGEGAARELREVPHVLPGVLVADEPQVVVGGGAYDLGDEPHLVHVVPPREERRPVDELHEDAPDGPDVDGRRVVGGVEQQLGGPVPPRDDVLRHHVALRRGARQAEVADLEVAVGVEEQVAGLEVPVDHVRRVDVLEPAQQLVQEVLTVLLGEFLVRADDVVEVRVHELQRDVHVVEGLRDRRRDHVPEGDDVFVVEVPEQLDLPERALRIHVVVERVRDLLYGHHLPRLEVHHRADDPVCAATDGHDGRLVLGGDLELVPEYVVEEEPAAVRHGRPELGHRSAVHSTNSIATPPSPPLSPLSGGSEQLDRKQAARTGERKLTGLRCAD